jgi:hypothetical protein
MRPIGRHDKRDSDHKQDTSAAPVMGHVIADSDLDSDQRAALQEYSVCRTGYGGAKVWLRDEVDGCWD